MRISRSRRAFVDRFSRGSLRYEDGIPEDESIVLSGTLTSRLRKNTALLAFVAQAVVVQADSKNELAPDGTTHAFLRSGSAP